jgi:hypothetical protein
MEDSREAKARLAAFLESGRLKTLFPTASRVTQADIRSVVPEGLVYACDFYVDGFEDGQVQPGGILKDSIFNIDHHADLTQMRKMISSGNLAIQHVTTFGIDPNVPIFINHTDADSMISSLIMAGVLPPEEELFGAAVIAADHTGAANVISDLLQGLDKKLDYHFSAIALIDLLAGNKLHPIASEALLSRQTARLRAMEITNNSDHVTSLDHVALVQANEALAGEMYSDLFQTQSVVILVQTVDDNPVTRIRLTTKGMEQSLSLHDLKLSEIVPGWGGRWNAGSDRRAGGSGQSYNPLEVAQEIERRLQSLTTT